jgi:hypothetical protein
MAGLIDSAPTVGDLLEIEPEDLSLIIIELTYGIQPPSHRFSMSHFEMPIWNANVPGYPTLEYG